MNKVVHGEFPPQDKQSAETLMNLTMKERQLECAARSLLAAADLGAHIRTNYVAILESMQTYVSRASEHAHANAELLMDYLEKVSNAHCVSDFADAACVLSERQLELSSRRATDLVVLAQKTTIIALDAGSSIPTPPRPIPDRPDEAPLPGPRGPRTPYPVNDPCIADPEAGFRAGLHSGINPWNRISLNLTVASK
jgi:hypothetical protein